MKQACCYILFFIFMLEVHSFILRRTFKANIKPLNNLIILFQQPKLIEVTNLDTKPPTKIMIEPGKPLSLACTRSELRLSFQCKQGSCASCEILLDGKRVRTCITKVPDKSKITVSKAPKL